MTPRHIVLVAPPWYPVPPHGYGGIELVVHLLAEGLRLRGERVTVLAAAGSAPPAIALVPAGWDADLGGANERLRELVYAKRVIDTILTLGPIDVVHDHVGFGTLVGLLGSSPAPVVHTVHGPVTRGELDFLGEAGTVAGLVAISNSQRRRVPSLNWIDTVHNAVDLRHLMVAEHEKEPYLLCLARICHDKGQHVAIDVARRLGMRLVLAGKVERSPAGAEYFRTRVAPFIDGDRVVHLNNVSGTDKALLLARARAFLAPVQWDEPFGLALVEAMASGTPVVSMARGAACELVTEGVTGFLVRDVDEMVRAVRRVAEIDLRLCAATARRRFSPEAMAEGYLRAYDRVCDGEAGGRALVSVTPASAAVAETATWLAGRRLEGAPPVGS